MVADLRDESVYAGIFDRTFDEVYQLAADMGGAGYLFTGDHDADVMCNSGLINLHMARWLRRGVARRLPGETRAALRRVGLEDRANQIAGAGTAPRHAHASFRASPFRRSFPRLRLE